MTQLYLVTSQMSDFMNSFRSGQLNCLEIMAEDVGKHTAGPCKLPQKLQL